MDSVLAARMGRAPSARSAKPTEPAFIDAPALESVFWCESCGEGRFVVGLVENRNEQLPQRDARRAGTRW
jgi:hypothetical protein